jgi:hypothetical protein
MCIAGTVVLEVDSVVVVAVLRAVVVIELFIGVVALVLVACGTVVVGSDAAPDVLTVPVDVAGRELRAADVVGPPALVPPKAPGNAGPEEPEAALEWDWTGR